jgi:hypothetical protein
VDGELAVGVGVFAKTDVAGGSVAGGSVLGGSVLGGSVVGGSVVGGAVVGGAVVGGAVVGGAVVGGAVVGGAVAIVTVVDGAVVVVDGAEDAAGAVVVVTGAGFLARACTLARARARALARARAVRADCFAERSLTDVRVDAAAGVGVVSSRPAISPTESVNARSDQIRRRGARLVVPVSLISAMQGASDGKHRALRASQVGPRILG